MPLFIVVFTFTLDLLKYAIVTRSFDLIFASVTLQRFYLNHYLSLTTKEKERKKNYGRDLSITRKQLW